MRKMTCVSIDQTLTLALSLSLSRRLTRNDLLNRYCFHTEWMSRKLKKIFKQLCSIPVRQKLRKKRIKPNKFMNSSLTHFRRDFCFCIFRQNCIDCPQLVLIPFRWHCYATVDLAQWLWSVCWNSIDWSTMMIDSTATQPLNHMSWSVCWHSMWLSGLAAHWSDELQEKKKKKQKNSQ